MPRGRRGNGEGCVYKRADGQWVGTIRVGTRPDGKPDRRTVYGATQAECRDKLTRLRSQRMDGTLAADDRLTVADFLARWLEDVARPTVRPGTFQSYEELVRLHVVPHVGAVPLVKLRPMHVDAMLGNMERAGLSPRRRQMARAVLRRALQHALKRQMVPRNVVDVVDAPRVPPHEIQPPDAAQLRRFLDAVRGHRLEALYVVAVSTGMRQGELLALQWGDVDLDAGTLRVRRTIRRIKGEMVVGEPKSKKSRRQLDLSAVAVDALRERRRLSMTEGVAGSPWVFPRTNGEPIDRHSLINCFRPLLKRAGLPETTRFHDLRHASASLLLAAGTHPVVVQERLGHSRIAVTLDVYSHSIPSMGRDAAHTMDRLLARASGE